MAVAPVQITIGVNWEVESNVRSWYRVEGACITPSCGSGGCMDPGDSSCGGDVATIQGQTATSGMKYVQVIPAKSLQDLCRLLSTPQPPFYTPVLCWKIQSVKKYNQTVNKVVFTGGGCLLKGLKEIAANNFKAEIEIGHPFSKVGAPPFLDKVLENIGPEFAVALGLALRKLQ